MNQKYRELTERARAARFQMNEQREHTLETLAYEAEQMYELAPPTASTLEGVYAGMADNMPGWNAIYEAPDVQSALAAWAGSYIPGTAPWWKEEGVDTSYNVYDDPLFKKLGEADQKIAQQADDPEELLNIIESIRRKQNINSVLAESGAMSVMAGSVLAEAANPVNYLLMAVGAGVTKIPTAAKILSAANNRSLIAAAGLGATAGLPLNVVSAFTNEANLKRSQVSRTREEARANIIAELTFGAVLGGAGGALSRGHVKLIARDAVKKNAMLEQGARAHDEAIDIMRQKRLSSDKYSETLRQVLEKKGGIEEYSALKIRRSGSWAGRRVQQSVDWLSRQVLRTPFHTAALSPYQAARYGAMLYSDIGAQREFVPDELLRVPLDAVKDTMIGQGLAATKRMKNAWRTAKASGSKMDEESFMRIVGDVANFGDEVSPRAFGPDEWTKLNLSKAEIDAINGAAKELRGELQKIHNLGANLGAWARETDLGETAETYFTRVWDNHKVRNNDHRGFASLVRAWAKDENARTRALFEAAGEEVPEGRLISDLDVERTLENVAGGRSDIALAHKGDTDTVVSTTAPRKFMIPHNYSTTLPDGRKVVAKDFMQRRADKILEHNLHFTLPNLLVAERLKTQGMVGMVGARETVEKARKVLGDAPDGPTSSIPKLERDIVEAQRTLASAAAERARAEQLAENAIKRRVRTDDDNVVAVRGMVAEAIEDAQEASVRRQVVRDQLNELEAERLPIADRIDELEVRMENVAPLNEEIARIEDQLQSNRKLLFKIRRRAPGLPADPRARDVAGQIEQLKRENDLLEEVLAERKLTRNTELGFPTEDGLDKWRRSRASLRGRVNKLDDKIDKTYAKWRATDLEGTTDEVAERVWFAAMANEPLEGKLEAPYHKVRAVIEGNKTLKDLSDRLVASRVPDLDAMQSRISDTAMKRMNEASEIDAAIKLGDEARVKAFVEETIDLDEVGSAGRRSQAEIERYRMQGADLAHARAELYDAHVKVRRLQDHKDSIIRIAGADHDDVRIIDQRLRLARKDRNAVKARISAIREGMKDFEVLAAHDARLQRGVARQISGVPDASQGQATWRSSHQRARQLVDEMGSEVESKQWDAYGRSVRQERLALSIDREWELARDAAKSDRARVKADNERKRALDALHIANTRFRNMRVAALQSEPGVVARIEEGILDMNYVRLMGGVTLSSIPDVATTLMHVGLRDWVSAAIRFMGVEIGRIADRVKSGEWKRDDMIDLMHAIEITNSDARMQRFAGLDHAHLRPGNSWDARARRTARKGMNKINLIGTWNKWTKSVAALAYQGRIIREMKRKGGISKKMLGNIKKFGISDEMLGRFRDQLDKFAGRHRTDELKGTLSLAQTDRWTDREAAQEFESMLTALANNSTLTLGSMDLGSGFDMPFARLLLQFQSFGVATTNRVLSAGLTGDQADLAATSIAMVGLGYVAHELKGFVNGRDLSEENLADKVANAIDRSGLPGALLSINGALSKGMGVDPMGSMIDTGFEALGGEERASGQLHRWSSRSAVDAWFGPAAGLAVDVAALSNVTRSNLNPDAHDAPTAGQYRSAFKTVPYNNAFYLRGILDKIVAPRLDYGANRFPDAAARSLGLRVRD